MAENTYIMSRVGPGEYEGQYLIDGVSISFFVYRDGNFWCAEVHDPYGTEHMTYHTFTKKRAIEQARDMALQIINGPNKTKDAES